MTSLRKTLEPHHLTAITDSREQRPLILDPIPSIRGTLTTGDYSLVGLTDVIVAERKSLDDLVQCVGHQRERFEREVKRLLAYESRAIFIECEWSDIEQHKYRSKTAPAAVIGSIMSWASQGLPIILCGDHARAGVMVSRFLFCAARRRYRQLYPFAEKMLAG